MKWLLITYPEENTDNHIRTGTSGPADSDREIPEEEGKPANQKSSHHNPKCNKRLVHPEIFYKLKGEYEDYTWGCHRKPLDYPLPWFPISISSVDPIFSNRQNNPRHIPYFSYFYVRGKSTFKTTIKTKRRIILKITLYFLIR